VTKRIQKKKTVAPAKPIGRPTSYNSEIAGQICDLIAEGKSVRSICKADDMPAERTVFGWLTKHPEFVQQYACAHEAQADTFAGEIIEIADDSRGDYVVDEDGEITVNFVAVQRAKLRCDQRKWLAVKRNPKKYGDAAGAVATASVTINNNPPDELAIVQRIAFLLIEQQHREAAKAK
jgi:hypothetical protein